jgi:hypothetical protein
VNRLICSLLLAAGLIPAQDWYPHNNFTVSGGFARPRGDIGGLFDDAPAFGFGYGYRFHPNFQVETGLDTAFGAAGVRDYLNTDFGPRRIRDYQFFVPFGGRAIIPLAQERFWIAGGAGGAYLNYRERISQPSDYYRIDCYACSARSGWGYYGLVNVGTALDRGRHLRLGITAKMYRAHTEGEPLGNVPGLRTRDKWLMITGDFGFSF